MVEERVVARPATGTSDGKASSSNRTWFAAVAGARGSRRRRWFVIAVSALVVLGGSGLAVGLTLRHLDRQYGSLQGGNFYGPYRDHGFAFSKNGGSFHLKPAPNATGQVIGALTNLGSHSVKVTSIETGPIAARIEWSVYRLVNAGSVYGLRRPWHTFPATIPAHGTIRLLITIHHPSNCDQYPKFHGVSDARYLPTHWVHWESLLHDHSTLVDIFNDDDGIRVC